MFSIILDGIVIAIIIWKQTKLNFVSYSLYLAYKISKILSMYLDMIYHFGCSARIYLQEKPSFFWHSQGVSCKIIFSLVVRTRSNLAKSSPKIDILFVR